MLARPHRARRQLVGADVAEVLVCLAWRQVRVLHAHLGQLLVQVAFDLDEVDRRLLPCARQEIPADLGDGDVPVDRRLRLYIAQRIKAVTQDGVVCRLPASQF